MYSSPFCYKTIANKKHVLGDDLGKTLKKTKILAYKVLSLPLAKRWSIFDRETIDREYDTYGIYELGNSKGEIVYIGQGRVRQRLNVHWNDVEGKPRISYYRCTYCGRKYRAKQMERVEMSIYEEQHGELPLYNRIGWLSPR